jgi:hypothetical protein
MPRTSVFLTAVVSMVLGIAIGVVGIGVLGSKLSPNAGTVANELSEQDGGVQTEPQVYGNR